MSWFKDRIKGDSNHGSPARQPRAPTSTTRNGKMLSPQSSVVQRPKSGTDPDTCLEVFRSHWLQAVTIMNKANGASASAKRHTLAEEDSELKADSEPDSVLEPEIITQKMPDEEATSCGEQEQTADETTTPEEDQEEEDGGDGDDDDDGTEAEDEDGDASMEMEVDAVSQHVDQMMLLLMEEEGEGAEGHGQGPILQYLLAEDVLEKILMWSSRVGEHVDRLRLHHLKTYDLLISQANQVLLIHKPVIRPLLKLLAACAQHPNKIIEKQVLLLVHALCVCVTQNTQILELLFNAGAEHGPAKFLVFSLLIPYVHREGVIGQQARDALLLIMALSNTRQSIGVYIAEHSDFCPVLATGLSGLYSSLPRKWNITTDDWYQLTDEDINSTPDLAMFLNSLEFSNAVVQVAHPLVRDQLLTYIHNGFLVPVIGPALHQNDYENVPESMKANEFVEASNSLSLDEEDLYSDEEESGGLVSIYWAVARQQDDEEDEDEEGNSLDEVITATAYLELFIRRITEPAMMRTFLSFILTEKHDQMAILDSLIARISSNSRLCMVSLSLFRTLVDLNCEDVMYQLVLKYLIPCTHVMVSQRRCVRDLDLYSRTAERFLSLTPACCMPDMSDSPEGAGTPAQNSPGSRSSSSSIYFPETVVTLPPPNPSSRPSAMKRLSLFRRSSKTPIHAPGLNLRRSSSPDVISNAPYTGFGSKLEHFETSYMEYLDAAKVKIRESASACKCWGYPYDGENPSPESLLPPPETPSDDFAETPEKPPIDLMFCSTPKNSNHILSKSASTPGEVKSSSDFNDSGIVPNERVSVKSPDQSAPFAVSSIGEGCGEGVEDEVGSKNETVSSEEVTRRLDGLQITESDDVTKLPIIPESTRLTSSQRDSYAESVTSEADSALSGSSSNTDNLPSGAENPGSRSDTPLNDNFDTMDFNTFLLSLKRVKTPVEFCDNIEESLTEMDAMINDLKHEVRTARTSSTRDSHEHLPNFVNSTITEPTSVVRPCVSNLEPLPIPSRDLMTVSKDSLVDSLEKATGPDSDITRRTPDAVPRRSSSLSDTAGSRSSSFNISSAFTPSKAAPVTLSLTPARYNFGTPNIGGFLTALLNKLETMMQNSLYVNLLLTGLFSRLACYSQPLLRSFLLNHSLVFQPSVKSLVQVLGSVKHKVDCYSYTVKDFESLLLQARRFLAVREGMPLFAGVDDRSRQRSDSTMSLPPTKPDQHHHKAEKKRSGSVISDFFRRHNGTANKGRLLGNKNLQLIGDGYRFINRPSPPPDGAPDHMESVKTKNAVYCALVLEEFLKELAAVCQEHAVLNMEDNDVSS